MKLAVLLVAMAVSSSAFAHEHDQITMPKEFDQLKALVGTWEGTTKKDGKEMPATVTYEVTSGGTILMERLFPGTPHEMVSIYHKDGKSLAMTHYCAMGNQPQMNLKKADGKQLSFEMLKPIGVSSMKEMHMHALTLTMPDPDSLTQEWTNYQDGKKGDTAIFTFKRKKQAQS